MPMRSSAQPLTEANRRNKAIFFSGNFSLPSLPLPLSANSSGPGLATAGLHDSWQCSDPRELRCCVEHKSLACGSSPLQSASSWIFKPLRAHGPALSWRLYIMTPASRGLLLFHGSFLFSLACHTLKFRLKNRLLLLLPWPPVFLICISHLQLLNLEVPCQVI